MVAQEIMIKPHIFGAANGKTLSKWYFRFSVTWSQIYFCPVTANNMGETLIHISPCSLHWPVVLAPVMTTSSSISHYHQYAALLDQALPNHIFLVSFLLNQDKRAGQRSHAVSPFVGTSITHLSIPMPLHEGNPMVTGGFHHKRPVMQSLEF